MLRVNGLNAPLAFHKMLNNCLTLKRAVNILPLAIRPENSMVSIKILVHNSIEAYYTYIYICFYTTHHFCFVKINFSKSLWRSFGPYDDVLPYMYVMYKKSKIPLTLL